MEVEYFYCASCGYEAFDINVGFSRTTASENLYICPSCKKESSCVDVGDE